MKKNSHDFNLMLAQRILYQIDRNGWFKPQGKTLDEIGANIKKSQELVVTMIDNDEVPR